MTKLTHTFALQDSKRRDILVFDSSDKEPFWLPESWFTRDGLVELRYAIDKAIALIERQELGERLAAARTSDEFMEAVKQ